MNKNLTPQKQRAFRIRAKLLENSTLPRLIVDRTNNNISAQIIGLDGRVLAAATSLSLKDFKGTKVEASTRVGELLAEKSKGKVEALVFDRGSYRFHGRVKALAEAVRKSGIKF